MSGSCSVGMGKTTSCDVKNTLNTFQVKMYHILYETSDVPGVAEVRI
jgi:hypothetical protein